MATTTPTTKKTTVTSTTSTASSNQTFLFDRENYMWMLGGIALILIGFALMAGGKSPNPHEFLYKEIYSFRRITLAPIVVLLGFGIEVYAIMKKPKGGIE
jgi:hypothetical protein